MKMDQVTLDLENSLIGQTYDLPRPYGHARYEIVGTRQQGTSGEQTHIWIPDDENPFYFKKANQETNLRGIQYLLVKVKKIHGMEGVPQKTFNDMLDEA